MSKADKVRFPLFEVQLSAFLNVIEFISSGVPRKVSESTSEISSTTLPLRSML